MAIKSNALTTVARTKTYLEITSSSRDTVIELMIDGVSDFIQNIYLGRSLERTTYTDEVYDGQGTESFTLKNYPVDTTQSYSASVLHGSFDTGSWNAVSSDSFQIDGPFGILKGLGGSNWHLTGA
jgi:hypothetical protein